MFIFLITALYVDFFWWPDLRIRRMTGVYIGMGRWRNDRSDGSGKIPMNRRPYDTRSS